MYTSDCSIYHTVKTRLTFKGIDRANIDKSCQTSAIDLPGISNPNIQGCRWQSTNSICNEQTIGWIVARKSRAVIDAVSSRKKNTWQPSNVLDAHKCQRNSQLSGQHISKNSSSQSKYNQVLTHIKSTPILIIQYHTEMIFYKNKRHKWSWPEK